MITYSTTLDDILPSDLSGFFEGWPNPPSPETHLSLLRSSDRIVVAIDDATGQVVGFVTAITDNVLSAYLPLLEVRREHRGQGIARQLLSRILAEVGHLYMVDAMCDEAFQPMYRSHGMEAASGVSIRRFEAQSGEPNAVGPA